MISGSGSKSPPKKKILPREVRYDSPSGEWSVGSSLSDGRGD